MNTATREDLIDVSGLGEEIADAIIRARPFASIDELLDIPGIGPRTLDRLKHDGLTVDMPETREQPTPAQHDEKAIVRRYIEEVWNKGNLEVADELIASDFNQSIPGYSGPDGEKRFFNRLRTIFPDWRFRIDDIISEHDKVVVQWSATGTHIGFFMGFAPTGMPFTVTGVNIYRVAGGRLIEDCHSNWDRFGLLQQTVASLPDRQPDLIA